MGQQKLSDFTVNHRLMVIEPTRAMQKITDEIMILQTQYRKLEEAEQRTQFNAFKAQIRAEGEAHAHKDLSDHADSFYIPD